MRVATAMRIMSSVIFLAVLVVRDTWVPKRVPMEMIRGWGDQFIEVGIEIITKHPLVMCPGNQMPEVVNYVVGKKPLSMVVVIQSPGVCGPVRHYLKCFLRRMVAPN